MWPQHQNQYPPYPQPHSPDTATNSALHEFAN